MLEHLRAHSRITPAHENLEDETMTAIAAELPSVATRDEWLAARLELLKKEKEHTRMRDTLNAARRRLPMVKVAKDYRFRSPTGEKRLIDMVCNPAQASATSSWYWPMVMTTPERPMG